MNVLFPFVGNLKSIKLGTPIPDGYTAIQDPVSYYLCKRFSINCITMWHKREFCGVVIRNEDCNSYRTARAAYKPMPNRQLEARRQSVYDNLASAMRAEFPFMPDDVEYEIALGHKKYRMSGIDAIVTTFIQRQYADDPTECEIVLAQWKGCDPDIESIPLKEQFDDDSDEAF